jgi:small multidrug resistance family-3 protein
MISIVAYIGAALAEIAGCFAFWAWLRLGKSILWLVPGAAALVLLPIC